eukprot:scaffold5815_cov16-Tisochrysis_lutea.AAC.1
MCQGAVPPATALTPTCVSDAGTSPALDSDTPDDTPGHQALSSTFVPDMQAAAPRSTTCTQQPKQQQQRRYGHARLPMQQSSQSAKGSGGRDGQRHAVTDGQLPPSWVSSLQQSMLLRRKGLQDLLTHQAIQFAGARSGCACMHGFIYPNTSDDFR